MKRYKLISFVQALIHFYFQVTLLWRRAVGDPGFKRLFCLVHAEKLSYQVCDRALWTLDEITQGRIGVLWLLSCMYKCVLFLTDLSTNMHVHVIYT